MNACYTDPFLDGISAGFIIGMIVIHIMCYSGLGNRMKTTRVVSANRISLFRVEGKHR